MAEPKSYFTDGAAYERRMGRWSRTAGEVFLDWLSLPNGLRWLDVGCGTGAFTELVVERCSPGKMSAVDPSADQISFAQARPSTDQVDYRIGDARELPCDDSEFDVAAMALVISFVPEPAQAIAEMKRVVAPGGTVASYMWDMASGCNTQRPMREALEAMGVELPPTPRIEFTRLDAMRDLLGSVGLDDVAGRTIEIQLEFANFDDYWTAQTGQATPITKPILAMSAEEVEQLKASLRKRLPTNTEGRITYMARANAVKGRVPE